MYDSEHSRWQAVQGRCKAADSAFVYAVITTKIFCRPTCPARLARRANVRFYDTSINALRSGFRPCKRCKPDQVHLVGTDITKPQKELVKKACIYIKEMKGETTLKDIAQHVGISARYLHGVFKEITGSTPAVYAARFKIEDSSAGISNESSPSTLESFGTTLQSTLSNSDIADDAVCEDPVMDFAFYTSVESYEAAEEQLKDLYDQQCALVWNSDGMMANPTQPLKFDWEKCYNPSDWGQSLCLDDQQTDFTDMEAMLLPVENAVTWPDLDMGSVEDWPFVDFGLNQSMQPW
ncbi:hypothetical protein LTR10_016636 [Elasticomyces elasticus]|uniref:HTH araC/xylS-type domain-containing protein n=1 Tax=Exophiala sideris TaxID=1016849 RepID=A0ABR0JJP6_9EURO|nr:hypothetical protein LTR10_016636 [Elasticomyces elasticus]KAK5035281.1 hypothetical protein LTS07_002717 [Exophiala sideris]KAK5039367.1 hypothetical protein LTR13_003624 [Exophiala sideris]KAK5066205.1 hypothetical protein LTR69_002723 [Exophiala sideris]KAK5186882.1 hypothetical protein LTR44_000888 [Eurotiomycetes sp. CCFEE 6388]